MDDTTSANTMFHPGNLQSGIALAIQQRKLVACFIHSPCSPSSHTWETEYLTANTCSGNVCGQIGSLIQEKAVLLRIELGSEEAGFLGAFVEVARAPALVVVKEGRVLEKIEGEGVGREEFVERLGKAVGLDEDGEVDGREVDEGAEEEVLESDPLIGSETQQQAAAGSTSTTLTPGEQPTSFPSHSPSEVAPLSSQATTLLAERARRLEADRLRRDADEKTARLARQKARQEVSTAAARQTATTEQNEKQRARDAWIYQQKQRKDEAKKEKERILKQIESDRQERKAAAQRRKEGAGGAGEFSELLAESGERAVATGVRTGSCALQIRLFDGSSIKGKFAAEADLATAVRTWVKEASPEGGADIPYEFRQILAPKPSRSIEVGEEGQTLADLGLAPTATLVLVPVSDTVEAYSGNGGVVGTAVNSAYWLGNTAYSFGSSLLGAIPFLGPSSSSLTSSSSVGGATGGPYMAGTGDPQDLSNARGADMAGADGAQTGTKMRVKTLADQRAEQARKRKEGTEFYNGNSSAFQGDGGGK